MKKADMIVRILLGLMMIVFGLNKFLHFIPMPPPNDNVVTVFGALMLMGVLPVVAVIEIVGGLLLLLNKQVGVALSFLAPVAFCAFLFHLMLDPAGIGGAVFFLSAVTFLIFTRKNQFKTILDE
tara:strand:- start:41563 stop:41934 length:372 start_codon:yes stop_codon:yes gene_type:complete